MLSGIQLRDVFFSTRPLDEQDYVRSRKISILEGCSARAVYNLTSGAFLAGYASFLGADDAFNGIIGAIPVLAAVISMFAPMYFEKKEKRKLLVAVLNFLHRFILGLAVFIPMVATSKTSRLFLLAAVYLTAYLAVCFANPAASGILIDLTPENIRGRYFGRRESFVLAVGILFSLVLGRVMDAFKSEGNEYGGFVAVYAVILVLSFANFYFWSRIREPIVQRKRTNFSLKQIVVIPLKNAGFRKVLIFYVLYNIGLQVGSPFFSVYMVTGLNLDYTYIMLMSTLSTIVNVSVVRVWGKFADSRSWDFVLKYSILLLGITHFLWLFVNQSTDFLLVPLLYLLSGLAWAGIGISTFNIQFIFSPEEGRTVYIGFNAALGGLLGFLGTLAGSALLVVFGRLHLNIAGFPLSGMQIVLSTSGILLSLSAVYVHFFIKQSTARRS